MTPTIDDEKILEELKEHRRNIIFSLYRHGRVGAGRLWRINGVPRGSKELHYEKLQEWGLIEKVGTQENKGGNPERVFALTDDGTQFVENYLVDTDEAPDAYAVKIDRALDEIGQLRGTVDQLETTVDQQADVIEKLRDEREEELDKLETGLIRTLQGDKGNWRADLRDEIIDELRDEDRT